MDIIDILFGTKKKDDATYGDAKHMSWSDQRKLFASYDANGYCIDGKRFLREKYLFQHCLYLAPTGSGKSVCITNFLLSLTSKTQLSGVVIDPSGTTQKITEGWLTKQGFKVKCLSFNEITSDTLRYNPLERATKTENGIAEIAQLIVFSSGDKKNDFWTLSEKSVIENILKALLQENQSEYPKNLFSLYKIINLLSVDEDKISNFMAGHLTEDQFLEFASFLGLEQKVRSNILATAKASLSSVSSEFIKTLTEYDNIELEKLREEKTILFINIGESKIKYYSFLISMLNTQLIEMALQEPQKKKPYLPIHFFFDEFATYKILGFEEIVPILRRRKCALYIYVQDINQLEQAYGKTGSKIIINNCLNKMFFATSSIETSEYAEKLVGNTTVLINDTPRPLALLSAQKIRGFEQWKFLYVNNSHSLVMKVKPFFKSSLKRRANLPIPKKENRHD
ncbi:MAG: type IV secretory system conjugative DNA transfer family protein [Bacteroidota bacterium]